MSVDIPYLHSSEWTREVAALPPRAEHDCFVNRLNAWLAVRFPEATFKERVALGNLLEGVAEAAQDYARAQELRRMAKMAELRDRTYGTDGTDGAYARKNRTDGTDGTNADEPAAHPYQEGAE